MADQKGKNMKTYRKFIESRKKEWCGAKVLYKNEEYCVVDVDYNGFLLINKKGKHTDTTAVSILDIFRK